MCGTRRARAHAREHERHDVGWQANRLTSHAAISFYERVGFRSLGTRRFKVDGTSHDDPIVGMSLRT